MSKSGFNVNDQVEWASQAAGYKKTKQGRVLAVVPAGKTPRDLGVTIKDDPGSARTEASYIVEVQRPRSVKLYWPRVSGLRLVGKALPLPHVSGSEA
jgi:hypothetical protein